MATWSNDHIRRLASTVCLSALTLAALCLCYMLIAPFLKPILFAAIFAVVFYPAHAPIRRYIRNSNTAAALSTASVILVIGAFSFFVSRALVSGLQDVYRSL